MKLALITAYPNSPVTLSEYGYHLVKHFRNHPDITELVLLTDTAAGPVFPEADGGGCKLTVEACWTFNAWSNVLRIRKAIRRHQPDAVLYNMQFLKFGDRKIPAALGLLGPWLTRLQGIPVITLMHNILETVELEQAGITASPLKKMVYRIIGTQLTRIILRSDLVALTIGKYVDILEKKYRARNLALVPHGAFETPPEPDYRLPEGPMKLLAFGKFGTYKRVEILIEAAESLRQNTLHDVEIVIAGTDSPNTPGYLEDVARRYKHVPNLRFTGYVPEEAVAGLFREAAVAVFPYTATTGSSGVLHQAGTYGKAVVLPRIGDLAHLVEDEGYRGSYFEPDNPQSLADAMEDILDSTAYRMHLGQTNYRAACSLPMSEIVNRYVAYFKALQIKKQVGLPLVLDEWAPQKSETPQKLINDSV